MQSSNLTFELFVDQSNRTVLYRFDDVMNALDWTRESKKACFGLEVNRLVDDVFKACDWRRASQKACCGLEVKVGSG
jgi:hypothetical protein